MSVANSVINIRTKAVIAGYRSCFLYLQTKGVAQNVGPKRNTGFVADIISSIINTHTEETRKSWEMKIGL